MFTLIDSQIFALNGSPVQGEWLTEEQVRGELRLTVMQVLALEVFRFPLSSMQKTQMGTPATVPISPCGLSDGQIETLRLYTGGAYALSARQLSALDPLSTTQVNLLSRAGYALTSAQLARQAEIVTAVQTASEARAIADAKYYALVAARDKLIAEGWPPLYSGYTTGLYPVPALVPVFNTPAPLVELMAREVANVAYTRSIYAVPDEGAAQLAAKNAYFEALNRITGGNWHNTTEQERMFFQYASYAMALVAIPIAAATITGVIGGVTAAAGATGASTAVTAAVASAAEKGLEKLETITAQVVGGTQASTAGISTAEMVATGIAIPTATALPVELDAPVVPQQAGWGGNNLFGMAAAGLLIFMAMGMVTRKGGK